MEKDHGTRLALLERSIPNIETNVSAILKLLKGNGEGLTTTVALNKDRIKRIWWWLGGVSLSILGTAFWVIRTYKP